MLEFLWSFSRSKTTPINVDFVHFLELLKRVDRDIYVVDRAGPVRGTVLRRVGTSTEAGEMNLLCKCCWKKIPSRYSICISCMCEHKVWNAAVKACQDKVFSDGTQLRPDLVADLEEVKK